MNRFPSTSERRRRTKRGGDWKSTNSLKRIERDWSKYLEMPCSKVDGPSAGKRSSRHSGSRKRKTKQSLRESPNSCRKRRRLRSMQRAKLKFNRSKKQSAKKRARLRSFC
jgi:hypothetical protein